MSSISRPTLPVAPTTATLNPMIFSYGDRLDHDVLDRIDPKHRRDRFKDLERDLREKPASAFSDPALDNPRRMRGQSPQASPHKALIDSNSKSLRRGNRRQAVGRQSPA